MADLTKCPFCGCGLKDTAPADPVPGHVEWACGSVQYGREPLQSDACRVNELEARLEKAEALAKALLAALTGKKGAGDG